MPLPLFFPFYYPEWTLHVNQHCTAQLCVWTKPKLNMKDEANWRRGIMGNGCFVCVCVFYARDWVKAAWCVWVYWSVLVCIFCLLLHSLFYPVTRPQNSCSLMSGLSIKSQSQQFCTVKGCIPHGSVCPPLCSFCLFVSLKFFCAVPGDINIKLLFGSEATQKH